MKDIISKLEKSLTSIKCNELRTERKGKKEKGTEGRKCFKK